jgi:hypothetical protein
MLKIVEEAQRSDFFSVPPAATVAPGGKFREFFLKKKIRRKISD